MALARWIVDATPQSKLKLFLSSVTTNIKGLFSSPLYSNLFTGLTVEEESIKLYQISVLAQQIALEKNIDYFGYFNLEWKRFLIKESKEKQCSLIESAKSSRIYSKHETAQIKKENSSLCQHLVSRLIKLAQNCFRDQEYKTRGIIKLALSNEPLKFDNSFKILQLEKRKKAQHATKKRMFAGLKKNSSDKNAKTTPVNSATSEVRLYKTPLIRSSDIGLDVDVDVKIDYETESDSGYENTSEKSQLTKEVTTK